MGRHRPPAPRGQRRRAAALLLAPLCCCLAAVRRRRPCARALGGGAFAAPAPAGAPAAGRALAAGLGAEAGRLEARAGRGAVAEPPGAPSAAEAARFPWPPAPLVARIAAAALLPSALRGAVDLARGCAAAPAPWQAGFAVAWALNMVAIATPGRFDGRGAAVPGGTAEPPARFLTPAGWAFAIWGPIFLGEFLAMVYLTGLTAPEAAAGRWAWLLAPPRVGAAVAPWWCAGIAAQIGWCATFREPFGVPGLLVSSACLGLCAVLLGGAHAALCGLAAEGALGAVAGALVRLPITLHFGWISCAALVNLNNWMANSGSGLRAKLVLAYGSVAAAVAAAGCVSAARRDPVYPLVVAWSLTAVYRFSARDGSPGPLRAAELGGAAAAACMVVACCVWGA